MEIRVIIEDTLLVHWILLALFLLSFLIQWTRYLLVYLKLPLHKADDPIPTDEGISLIVCAKNEALNLERYLPLLLEQEHPLFEVIVVNDASTDQTEDLLIRLSEEYQHLRYTSVPRNDKQPRGKKLALTIGLKAARHELVVLTDADCYPASKKWLSLMAARLNEKTRIVLGYGGYERRRGILNSLIRYETVFTAIQYLSYALKGKAYMGVGRNLAYHKSLFFENKGFARHYHLLSGDDDLFVNENATSSNTAVEISPGAFTFSLPESSWAAWIKQKRRHVSAGSHYGRSSKFRLGMEWISRIMLYLSLIWLCISSGWLWPVLALFGVLLITRLVVFKMGMRRLEEKHLLLPSLLFDPVMPLVMGIIWLTGLFESKHQTWS